MILGQDCYHGEGQATGLCFGVHPGCRVPPSLRNILKECQDQIKTPNGTLTTDLEHWAKQGVLLLNCALTVRQASPGSHLRFWKPFMEQLITKLSRSNQGLIFLLWGSFAKEKKTIMPTAIQEKHYFLACNHPSPLSANRGGWFKNNHFKETNQILEKDNKAPIHWLTN